MRKITKQAIDALYNGKSYHNGNTAVTHYKQGDDAISEMRLHGNCIAKYSHVTGVTSINMCGWDTPTTRERLNGLKGIHVIQMKGKQYLQKSRCLYTPIDPNKSYQIDFKGIISEVTQ